MTDVRRTAFGVLVVIALVGGVFAVREATESRHPPTAPTSRTVIDMAASTNLDGGPSLRELVDAASTTCRMEIGARPVGPAAVPIAGDRYRIVLAPALDGTEELQYRGCLQDWQIDHLMIDVVTIRRLENGP